MRQGSVIRPLEDAEDRAQSPHQPGGLLGLLVEQALLLGGGGRCLWTCEAGLQETNSRALGTGRD